MPYFLLLTAGALLQAVVATTSLWLVITALRRLVFHPLARFPGPKLAGLTKWYEFYYDVVLKGHFTFHIQELHRKYGPIVRITPEEIHIQDSDFWDELYNSPKSDKYAWMAGRFGGPSAQKTHVDTMESNVHRVRRAALNPMFSKRAICRLEPLLRSKLDLVCQQLAKHAQTSKLLNLVDMWSAFTCDIITQYSWGVCKNALQSEGCRDNFHDAVMSVVQFGHFGLQFPLVHSLVRRLPPQWMARICPKRESLIQYRMLLGPQIPRLIKGLNSQEAKQENPIVFRELLQSTVLPPEDKAVARLAAETGNLVGAGVETVAWALSVGSFHIINNPRVCQRLKQELRELVPNGNVQADWRALERGTYLAACVREAVRLSGGLPGRSPRLLDKDIAYKGWRIPRRTPVSMSIWDVHTDEEIFPEHTRFLPERWLDNAKAPNGSSLKRYFVGFGKGDRGCLGVNLAQAELTMGLGTIFRRFDFELHETDETDVELAHDFALASPRLDSRGVRVTVKTAME